jgi:hypothetical protein
MCRMIACISFLDVRTKLFLVSKGKTPSDCEDEYTNNWLNCVINAGMICDSCVPGFPNLMDRPDLIPGEGCDDFLDFYEEKKDCGELKECQEFLEILLDCTIV